MESFTTARISSGKWFYLFDSHSRDEKELNVIYGSSALMKFNDLFEIEKYIQVVYLQYRDRQQAYFQIQFIEVRSIEKTEMYLQFAKMLDVKMTKNTLTALTRGNECIIQT